MTAPRVTMVLNTPGLGGVTEVVYQLLRHLPNAQVTPSLFFLKGAGPEDSGRRERLQRFADLGVEIGFASPGAGKIGMIAELAEWLAARSIDIVHTHSFRPNIYGRLAGAINRPGGLGIVAHYHNHYDDKWIADPAMLSLERRLAGVGDGLVAVSESVRDHVADYIGIDGERIDVIHNGVDAAAFQSGRRDQTRRSLGIAAPALAIGLVGRVCEQKGQEDLVEAAILLSNRLPASQFLMIGDLEDNALHARLTGRLESAGLSDSVRFVGFRSDIADVYAALDLIVAPSRWEGFPLMLLEAMSAGVPIVATRIGPIVEAVGTDGAAILVPPREPRLLAAAIREAIADAMRRSAIAASGRRRSQDFSWKIASDRLMAVYARVIDRQAAYPPCV